ncbi:hypothetical protein CHCC20375_1903 [Bacillus licheniformis]|nr:hypothetical protein CHCC20375_1903 [Bacillus licheniformis]
MIQYRHLREHDVLGGTKAEQKQISTQSIGFFGNDDPNRGVCSVYLV